MSRISQATKQQKKRTIQAAHRSGSKVFTCPECGYSIPRDYNGAFGILLKALRDTASISYQGDSAIVTLSGNRRVSVA